MTERSRKDVFAPAIVWSIITLCCICPLGWIVFTIAGNPKSLVELHLDAFRLAIIERTLIYNGLVALVATLIAIPAAITLGRGRGFLAGALWFVLPISLLIPSLTFAYGWKQFFRLIGRDFDPASAADVGRCIWSLATWLWPIPAVAMGLSLRRLDANVQQQALLDGGLWRITLRQLLAPTIASLAAVAMLAMQEFAVYEPTGISVIATETRMVFETGAFSSRDNPIIAPMTGNAAAQTTDQPARAAAAVAVSLPMLGCVAVLAVIARFVLKRQSTTDAIEVGPWPRALNARLPTKLLAWLVVFIALGLPLIALVLSLKVHRSLAFVWAEFGPQATGSITVAAIACVFAFVLALAATVKRPRGATTIAIASFLIGGQLVAIALIRIYNRPWLAPLYEGVPVIVMAYLARFGWIVLLVAGATFSGAGWSELRDMASLDGAGRFAAARSAVWPIAWPALVAGALFVGALSLGEVPATVLVAPQKPQLLVPLLMTWVHMLRYDAMIEASLMTAAIIAGVGAIAASLTIVAQRYRRVAIRAALLVISCCLLVGCDPTNNKPDEIWFTTGNGPGQVVYPRGIAYDAKDDSFFIVDRSAHVQHIDRDGKPIAEWFMPQSQQGKPVGLTVGPDGNLYVPDTHYHRILVYPPDGKSIVRQWGEKGFAPGQFIYPTDIAFDSKGNIFVSEYGDNDRVQVFDARSGAFLYQFGKFGTGDGEFSRPQSMVIDNEFVYITDSCNHRINVFKTDGTFVRNMGGVGDGPGQFRFPYGLDMDRNGDLIVCEFGNNRVQRIDKQTGKSKGTWGGAGREPGKMAYPWGVCVDKRDRIVAVDAGNNRVQVFEF